MSDVAEAEVLAKRLVGLRIAKVAGVDHPAHQAEGWAVLKDADGQVPAVAEVSASLNGLVGQLAAEQYPNLSAPAAMRALMSTERGMEAYEQYETGRQVLEQIVGHNQ